MFDIGLLELLLLSIVVLLVVGPRRLPETLRTLGLWMGRMRRSFTRVKAEIEREIGMDDVRRQLHNESIMEQMKELERDVGDAIEDAKVAPSKEQPSQTIHDTQGETPGQDAEPSGSAIETPLSDDKPREARDGG